MARLTLSILISFTIYFTYQALASEALSTSGVRSSSSSQSARSTEAMENLLGGRDDGLTKLQSLLFKNAYNRRSAGPVGPGGHIGTYTVLQRSPAMGPKLPLAYVADLNCIDDEDIEKRFDDYGHMRFGKRGGGGEGEQFDDYGHMRFGRRRR